MRHQILRLCSAGAVFLSAVSCSSDDESQYAIAALNQRAELVSVIYDPLPESLTAAMPSTRYDYGGDLAPTSLSGVVATGKFIGWSKGPAETWRGTDPESDTGIKLDWTDPAADIRTLKMAFAVDSVIDIRDGMEVAEELVVWVVVNGNSAAEKVAQGLIDLDQSLVFLRKPSRPEAKADWSVTLEGTLIGDVQEDGTFTMPMLESLEGEHEGAFTGITIDARTIAELETAAEQDRVIKIVD